MQFIRGVEEPTVPEVKLTRSRDGGQGTATLYFEKPAVFENTGEAGEITGLYMIDDEGEMSTVRKIGVHVSPPSHRHPESLELRCIRYGRDA